MSDDGSIFNKNGIDTSAKSHKKYKKVMNIAKKSLKKLKKIKTKKQSKRGGPQILAAKVAVKATVTWLAKWICTHPKIVKNIYTNAIILTKEVIKKRQENDGKLTKETIKDVLGVTFFKLLPLKEIFKKALKTRTRELKGKFTKKPKTGKKLKTLFIPTNFYS